MYIGWPKGWAVFRLAKEVWNEEESALTEKDRYRTSVFFPIGQPNDAYARYFVGQGIRHFYGTRRGVPARPSKAPGPRRPEESTPQKPAGFFVPAGHVFFLFYPSIRICFFSGTFLASFLGSFRLSTPFSYLALMSSSVMLPPT